MPYYFEFKTHLFSHFSELKIKMRLKFEVLFYTLWKSQKPNFSPKTSGLAERAVNFSDSEIYLLVTFFTENPFMKAGCALY